MKMVAIAVVIFLSLLIYILFFMRGKVAVEVVPTSAVVTLDNKPAPIINGFARFSTKFGTHILRVETDDYIGFKEEFKINRGKNYSRKISLKKAPQPIEIASSASNIAIKDDEIYFQSKEDHLFYLAKINVKSDGTAELTEKKAITSAPIDNFQKVIWSPNKEVILIKQGQSVDLFDFKKYDFVNQNRVRFGDNIGDIAWSPDNSRVAYFYNPPGEKSLIFADVNNNNITRALNFAKYDIDDPYLAFSPDSEWMVIIPRNKDYAKNKIYLLNVYTREFKAVSDQGEQKEAIFSANSDKIIYSSFSGDKMNKSSRLLGIMNLDGSDKKTVDLAAKASDGRYWKDANKIFLPSNNENSKLVLVDVNDAKTTEFFFSGQKNLSIDSVCLNEDKTAAIFTSNDKLYFVKLESN